MRCLFALLLCLAAAPFPAWAQESLDNLPVPRWAALATNEANLRTGPGKRYPIDWLLTKKGLPVEITQEFDTWRRVREPGGDSGWIHKSMLTGMRRVLLQRDGALHSGPESDSGVVAKLQKGVIAELKKCGRDWCELEAQGYDGWTPKNILWGVYPDETID